jgi:hypothetical protein
LVPGLIFLKIFLVPNRIDHLLIKE